MVVSGPLFAMWINFRNTFSNVEEHVLYHLIDLKPAPSITEVQRHEWGWFKAACGKCVARDKDMAFSLNLPPWCDLLFPFNYIRQ